MTFEESLNRSIFSGSSDKTFIDKMLARQDVDALREIIRKPRLTRSELLDSLYMLLSTESKLLNLGEWDRYVLLKFFVWIREFIKIAEILYDYTDTLKTKEKNKQLKLTENVKLMLDNIQRLIEHNAKFLIDLYLNIGRTSLSIGATGLMELLKNKYEVVYPNLPASVQDTDRSRTPTVYMGK